MNRYRRASDLFRALSFRGSAIVFLVSSSATLGDDTQRQSSIPAEQKVMLLRHWLFWCAILLVAAGIGFIALVRFARRFRQQIERHPRSPAGTVVSDVWEQHKLPPDWERHLPDDDDL